MSKYKQKAENYIPFSKKASYSIDIKLIKYYFQLDFVSFIIHNEKFVTY